jgi:hypothetical protein
VQLQLSRMVHEDYAIISIDPLNRSVQCTREGEAFAVASYSCEDFPSTQILNGDNISGETVFHPSLSRINVLRVQVRRPDGSVLTRADFADGDGNVTDAFDKIMLVVAFTHKNVQLS